MAPFRSIAVATRPSTLEPRKSAPSSRAPFMSTFLNSHPFSGVPRKSQPVKVSVSEVAGFKFARLKASKSKLRKCRISRSDHSVLAFGFDSAKTGKPQFTNSTRSACSPIASALAKSQSTSRTSFRRSPVNLLRVKLIRVRMQLSKTTDFGEESLRDRFPRIQSRTTTSVPSDNSLVAVEGRVSAGISGVARAAGKPVRALLLVDFIGLFFCGTKKGALMTAPCP
jgi:hypothetical protein